MRILHISDTHCLHAHIPVPDVDMIIHSGDCSNIQEPHRNANEVLAFLDWYAHLNVKYKVFVAGNHDTSIWKRLVTPEYIRDLGIIYLENNTYAIEHGVDVFSLWGSPITPTFSKGWAWNMSRNKIQNVWRTIPDNADIIITHGPPKGILDISTNREGDLEFCGCKSLYNRIKEVDPILCCFGHIHDSGECRNSGLTILSGSDTIYSNGSVIEDCKPGVKNYGNIFTI